MIQENGEVWHTGAGYVTIHCRGNGGRYHGNVNESSCIVASRASEIFLIMNMLCAALHNLRTDISVMGMLP